MVARSTVKPGDVLYDVHRYKPTGGGSRMGWWRVQIIEVDDLGALASWNGNRARRYSWSQIERFRRNPPKLREP